ncbi:MAG TPA: hypothetical protein VF773_19995 [Verrucomicrobiae bacterium]
MKKTILPLLAIALLLTACVPTLHPLYTPDTTVFREELIGIWKEKPDEEESWTFTKADQNTYKVTLQEKDDTSILDGRLVKLGDQLFLDLSPDGAVLENAKIGTFYRVALIPGHLIVKVNKLGANLEMQMLDYDKVKKFLETNPKALAHTFLDEDRLVITAPTPELQAFIKKHGNSKELWGDPGVMQKLLL